MLIVNTFVSTQSEGLQNEIYFKVVNDNRSLILIVLQFTYNCGDNVKINEVLLVISL